MFIEHLEINNFKSIQHLKLGGFKKINLLIGRPNVGKSNILEALGLFTVPYLKYSKNQNLKELIRLEQPAELFFNSNNDHRIEVNINGSLICNVILKTSFIKIQINEFLFEIDHNLRLRNPPVELDAHYFPIRKYEFPPEMKFEGAMFSYLLPPKGNDLMGVLELHSKLKEEVSKLFHSYNMKLVFDKSSQALKILKGIDNDSILLLPYNSIADTLRRIIFYKAAIATNENSVLLFEEPEAHAFPPYIAHITQEVIQSESNQFIMATHSPIIVNDFLEHAIDDLAIFMVDYKDNQTIVNRLSDEELKNIAKYGVDIFTNYEMYL